MQLRVRWCCGLLAALMMFAEGVRGDNAIKGDLGKIQGEWTMPSGFGGEVVYSFKDRELNIESPNRSYTVIVTLHPDAKPEKAIDFEIVEGPDDAKGKKSPGIYKFAKDGTLILCFRDQGDRPARFEQIGFEQIVSELKSKRTAPTAAARMEADGPKAADSDAHLPEEWPDATPPGRIEIKKYPAYRSTIARAKDGTSKNSSVLFFSLFNHIQRRGVAMTAPVVMTYERKVVEEPGVRGEVSMEFLYRRTDQGKAGQGVGAVKVEDFPASTFVCLGMQGRMDEDRLKEGVAKLHEWLRVHKDEWVEAGRPRRLGYHGPQTPVTASSTRFKSLSSRRRRYRASRRQPGSLRRNDEDVQRRRESAASAPFLTICGRPGDAPGLRDCSMTSANRCFIAGSIAGWLLTTRPAQFG